MKPQIHQLLDIRRCVYEDIMSRYRSTGIVYRTLEELRLENLPEIVSVQLEANIRIGIFRNFLKRT